MRFLTYNPEQAYRLPPSVREVLGEDPVCCLVPRAVERLDLGAFEQGYVEEGRPAYHAALLLKVWLYAYALGLTSARRLEQRVRQPANDCGSLVPLLDAVEQRCGERPQKVSADAGFFRLEAMVEPVIGVLKEQRGMRPFRRRGLAKVAVELTLAATAFNLTRLWRRKPTLQAEG